LRLRTGDWNASGKRRIPGDSSDLNSTRFGEEIKKNALTEELIKIPTHFRGLVASSLIISEI